MSGQLTVLYDGREKPAFRMPLWFLIAGGLVVLLVLVWQGLPAHGAPDPTVPKTNRISGVFDIGGLIFQEVLESILVLSAIMTNIVGEGESHRLPGTGGAELGFIFSALIGILTFVAHRRLPYRKMLVLTGGMLGVVLLVMVGEQAQEMQLAHWISTTKIDWLSGIPDWAGVWFSVYPTVETLVAQFLAALLVIGSYFFARRGSNEEGAAEAGVR